jgi:hypothetical protein
LANCAPVSRFYDFIAEEYNPAFGNKEHRVLAANIGFLG